MTWEPRFVCGTRAVKPSDRPGYYDVVCATCDKRVSGTFRSKAAANAAAIHESNKPCRFCGAR